jgi:hypothetical protein
MTPWITKPVPFNIGQGAAGAGTDWTEIFPFTSTSGWVQYIDTGNGEIGVGELGAGKMGYDGVDQGSGSYATKLFSKGSLSDTMWTMLVNKTIWTQVDTIPAPLFFGASDANNDINDGDSISFLGGLMAGCGSTKTGDHGAGMASLDSLAYSTCWTGNGSGSDNWDTVFRTSATGARFILYPTSAKSSSDYDETWTISSSITGLDRTIYAGQDAGPGSRVSDGSIDEVTFKNEVNEE